MKRIAKIGLIAGFFSIATQSSFGCAVCSVTNDEARYAYYATTAFLTLLPLFMIGGIVYYIAKKSR